MKTDNGKSCMKCGKQLNTQELLEEAIHKKDYADRPHLIGPTRCNFCICQSIWNTDASIKRIIKKRTTEEIMKKLHEN